MQRSLRECLKRGFETCKFPTEYSSVESVFLNMRNNEQFKTELSEDELKDLR